MNKLTKVLSVFIIAGAIGTGVAGVAGCKKNNHTHTYEETYTSAGDNGHYQKSTCGHEDSATVPHEYTDKTDTTCNAPGCGYVREIGGGEDPGKDPGGETTVTVTSVTVTAADDATTLKVEGTLQLSVAVVATPDEAANKAVTWSSSDTVKATVDENGLVTGVAAGEVTITATSTKDNTKKGEITLTIQPKDQENPPVVNPPAPAEYTTVYDNEYRTAEVQSGTASFPTEKGVYGASNATDPTMTEKNTVTIDGNVLKIVDTDTTATTFGYVSIENISYKKVSIEFGVTLTKQAGKWTAVRLVDGKGQNIIALRSDKDKKVGLTSNDGIEVVPGAFEYAADTEIQVSVVLDLVNGKATGTVTQGTKTATYSEDSAIDISATEFGGLKFQTATDARSINLTSLVVKTKDATVAELQTAFAARLDAEYAKYKLEGEDATHATNKDLVTAAYNTGKTAIAAVGVTAEQITTAYKTAVAGMADVLSDNDMTYRDEDATGAKVDANNALAAYIEAAHITINDVTIGEKSYGNVSGLEELGYLDTALNAVKTKTDLAAWLEIAKEEIDKIDNDETVLAAIKAAAIADIQGYKTEEELQAVKEKNENIYNDIIAIIRNADETAKPAVEAGSAIKAINALTAENVANEENGVEAILKKAKANIDRLVGNADKTLDDIKAEYVGAQNDDEDFGELGEYADKKLEAIEDDENETWAGKIDAAVSAGKTAVWAAEEANVEAAYTAATEAIDFIVDKYTAYQYVLDEVDKAEISEDDTANTAKVNKIVTDLNYFEAATADNLATLKAEAIKAIQDLVEELKETEYTVTYEVANKTYTLKVGYGDELTLDMITVPGLKVTAATLNEEDLDGEGVAIYADATVEIDIANLEVDEEYETTATWKPGADDVATGVTLAEENDFFKLEATGAEIVKMGSKVTIANKDFEYTLKSANINPLYEKVDGKADKTKPYAVHDNSATPFVITAKVDLGSLTIYSSLCDNAGTGSNRWGTIYYSINDGDAQTIKALTEKGDMKQAYTISNVVAGSVIKVWADNQSEADGARLHIYGVDAEIDQSAIPQTVNVTWTGKQGTSAYRHNEEITAPNPPAGNGEFLGWYLVDENDAMVGDPFKDGATLAPGTYTYKAKYEYTVKITYKIDPEDESEEAKVLYINAKTGNELKAKLPTLDPKDNNAHSGWTYENGSEIDFENLEVGENHEDAKEYTFVPVYSDPTSVKVETITVTGPIVEEAEVKTVTQGKTIQLTATVAPGNAYNKAVTWGCATEGVTVSETGLVTVAKTVAAGKITVTATAKDTAEGETPVTGSITLTVEAAPAVEKESYLWTDFSTVKKVDANGVIVDKTLFTATTLVALTGKKPAKDMSDSSGKIADPYMLVTTANLTANTATSIMKIKANADIKLTILMLANKNDENGARSSTLSYKVNGTLSDETKTTGGTKNLINAFEFDLKENDELEIIVKGTNGKSDVVVDIFGFKAEISQS